MGKTLDECYQILGLDSSASEVDVKTAYKQLALKCHPDKNPDDPEATRKFQELACAYKRITSGINEDEEWCDEDEFTFEDFLNFYCFVFRQELMPFHQQQRGHHGRGVVHNEHLDKNFAEECFEKQTSEYPDKTFTDEEMAKFTAFASLNEQKEANKRKFCPDGKKERSTKQGQKASKPKSKSNKQLCAEHWRRQQELSKVATEIERKKKQELEKEALKANSQNEDVKEEEVTNSEACNLASSLWKGKENVKEKQSNVKPEKNKVKKKRKQVKKEKQCEERRSKPQEFGHHSCGIETTVNPGKTTCFPKGHALPNDHSQHVKVSTARTRANVQRSCTVGSQKQEDPCQRDANLGTTRVQNQWTKSHSTSPNIWHRRQQQHEFLSKLQPVNETEEEQQLKMAIEMSKRQAEIDEFQREVHVLESELDGEEEMALSYMGNTYSSDSVAIPPPMDETLMSKYVDARVGEEAKPSRNTSENAPNHISHPTNRVTMNIGDIERKARACGGDGSGIDLPDDIGQQRVTEVKIKTVHASEDDQQLEHSDQSSQREGVQSSQRRRRGKSCVYGRNCCLGKKCRFSHPKQTQNTKKPSMSGEIKESEDHLGHKAQVNTGSLQVTQTDGSSDGCSEPCPSEKNLTENVFSFEDKHGLDNSSVQQDCRHATGDAKEPELKSHDHPQSEQGTFQYNLVKCGENSKAQVISTGDAEEPQLGVQGRHQFEQGTSQYMLVECEYSRTQVSPSPVEGEQSTGDAKEPHLKVQDRHQLEQGASQYKTIKGGEDSEAKVSSSPVKREQSTEDASSMPPNHWTEEQEAKRQGPSASSVKSEGTLNEGNQFVNPQLPTSGSWLAGCVPPGILPQTTIYQTSSVRNLSGVPAFPPLPFCVGMPMMNPYMPVPVQVQSTLNLRQQGLVHPGTVRQTHGPTNLSHDQRSNFLSCGSLQPNMSVEPGKNDFPHGVPRTSFLCQNAPVMTSYPSNNYPVDAGDQRCEVKSAQFCTDATSAASCAPTMGPVPYVQQAVYSGSMQMNTLPLSPLMPFVLPGVQSGNGVNGVAVGVAPVARQAYHHNIPQASECDVQKAASVHPLEAVKAKAAPRSGDDVKEGHLEDGVHISAVSVGTTPVAQKIHHQIMPQESECDMQGSSTVFSQIEADQSAPRNEGKAQVEGMLKRNQDQKSKEKLRRPMTVPKVMQKMVLQNS